MTVRPHHVFRREDKLLPVETEDGEDEVRPYDGVWYYPAEAPPPSGGPP